MEKGSKNKWQNHMVFCFLCICGTLKMRGRKIKENIRIFVTYFYVELFLNELLLNE